jgi:hypothetical protein
MPKTRPNTGSLIAWIAVSGLRQILTINVAREQQQR